MRSKTASATQAAGTPLPGRCNRSAISINSSYARESEERGLIKGQADRERLRRGLLSGIEGRVHFGKVFSRYEERRDGVVARFEDESSAQADLLMGVASRRTSSAWGIRTTVNAQDASRLTALASGLAGLLIPETDLEVSAVR